MRGALLVVLLSGLLSGLLWPMDGRAQLPEELAGRWRGPVVGEGGGEVRLAVTAQGDGFQLDLTLPDVPPTSVRMVPTPEPRVYQVAAAPRGLFSFFEGAGRNDPFEGVPLIWARTTATSLVAYRLALAPDGGMLLVRAVIEPAEEGLLLSLERRVDVRPPERLQALLEREG